MSERFTPFAASHAFIIKNGNILLLQRANTGWMDGMWTSPTGHIEPNETAKQAAIRETKEEAGITIHPSMLTHAITVHRKNPQSGAVYFDNYFTAQQWQGEPYVAEPNKASDIGWFELNNLPNDTIVPTVLRALQCYIKGERYAEHGW